MNREKRTAPAPLAKGTLEKIFADIVGDFPALLNIGTNYSVDDTSELWELLSYKIDVLITGEKHFNKRMRALLEDRAKYGIPK